MLDQSSLLEAKISLALTDALPVLSVSDSIVTLLGFSPDAFLDGRISLKSRIHPDDQDIADELFSRTIQHSPGTFNLRLRQANGRIRCIKGQYRKSLPESGHPVILELLLQDAKSLRQNLGKPPVADNLRAVMENTDDYIYFKDRNHVFTGASRILAALADPAEQWTDVFGQTDYDVFPEQYADRYYRLEKQVFSGMPVVHEVQEILTRDGQKVWADNRNYPIHDESGEIVGLFGVVRDVSEKNRAEEALTESEQRFRSIFEQVPMISVLGYDRDRRVIFWNPASEQLYGYARDQAVGRLVEDLIIPEPMRENWVRLISDFLGGGPAIPASELSRKKADGRLVKVFSGNALLRNRNGEPEVYCVDIDMSGRNQIAADLQHEDKFIKSVLDNLPGIFYLYAHPENRLVLWNKQHESLLGFEASEMSGRHVTDWFLPGYKDAVLRAIEEVMEFGESSIEAPLLTKEGHLLYFALSGVRIEAQDQSYYMGVGTDITERKKMEEQVRQLAFHDPLTSLPNRRLLHDRLSQAMAASKRSACHGALMFLDLDNFKSLNDVQGHKVGDLLLIEVAIRLKNCVREMDTVARFGGDEFVVMISELTMDKVESATQAGLIAEKIRIALSEPYLLKVKQDGEAESTIEYRCTASIGMTLFVGNDTSQDDLLKWADMAMYQAKDGGRNAVRMATESMQYVGEGTQVPADFAQLIWHSAYQCGNALIDDQHRSLFSDANRLLGTLLSGDPAQEAGGLIESLLRDVVQHFKDEEEVFTRAGFPGAAEHATIHRQLIESAAALANRFYAGSLNIGELFQFFALDLVSKHMLEADRAYFPYLK